VLRNLSDGGESQPDSVSFDLVMEREEDGVSVSSGSTHREHRIYRVLTAGHSQSQGAWRAERLMAGDTRTERRGTARGARGAPVSSNPVGGTRIREGALGMW
jgi:hypothetical protein